MTKKTVVGAPDFFAALNEAAGEDAEAKALAAYAHANGCRVAVVHGRKGVPRKLTPTEFGAELPKIRERAVRLGVTDAPVTFEAYSALHDALASRDVSVDSFTVETPGD